MIYLIILLIAFLLLNSFFNGCEIGLISSQKPRIAHFASSGHRRAAIIQYFIARPHLMISTTLVGVNAALVCTSVITEKILTGCGIKDDYVLLLTTTIVLTPLLLISEITAKDWFRQAPEERCLRFAPMLYASYWLMALPIKTLAAFAAWFINIATAKHNQKEDARLLLREDFRILLRDSASGGTIDHEAASLLDRALDFHKLRVGDIMIPIKNVKIVTPETTVQDAVELCRRLNVSRIPINSVCTSGSDQIKSIFSIYDAIFKLEESHWKSTLVMDCCRIPAVINVNDTLREVLVRAQTMRCQLLIVTNQQQQPVGIVTPNDVAEQLFE